MGPIEFGDASDLFGRWSIRSRNLLGSNRFLRVRPDTDAPTKADDGMTTSDQIPMTAKTRRGPLRQYTVTALALCMLALIVLPVFAFAQNATGVTRETVKIGLYESPPFVMAGSAENPSGMAVDLWEKLAEGLEITSDYTVYPSMSELRKATQRGDVGVAVTNMTVTHERAKTVDFTHPWFDGGMRILTNQTADTGLAAVIRGLSSAGHLKAYGWLALVIVLSTLGLTFFDRRFDPEFPKRWRDGVANSFHNVMSVVTSGRIPSRKNLFGWVGRIWSAIWLVCGIGVLAYVTSTVTSVMTTLAITGTITGPGDLPGLTVGVFEGTVEEEFAVTMGLDTRSYPGIESAVTALGAGNISAVIGDAPVLEYYVKINPGLGLDVVGPIFEPDKYAFALEPGSPLRKPITVQLLALKEDGTIDQLKRDYFGDAW